MRDLDQKGLIKFELPDDIVYEWDLTGNKFSGYKIIEAGWYDVGNKKYLYKLSENQPVQFLATPFGPEPMTYLEKKHK